MPLNAPPLTILNGLATTRLDPPNGRLTIRLIGFLSAGRLVITGRDKTGSLSTIPLPPTKSSTDGSVTASVVFSSGFFEAAIFFTAINILSFGKAQTLKLNRKNLITINVVTCFSGNLR